MFKPLVSRVASVALACALGTGASVALAQAFPPPGAAPMSFQQVIDRVASQGYVDVREIERKSDKLYEIEARDRQGRRVELSIDSRSGEILREKVKR